MVLYSKFIAKAMPNKMHMGNNPKTMYMLGFITCYCGKTLNCYKKYYHIYMKTKRNKKQKNRSFRKNRSFKKKGLKKNHTRKNVGGHLMGFDVGTIPYILPNHMYGDFLHSYGAYDIRLKFSPHSFKHLDSFDDNGAAAIHNNIIYPICKIDRGIAANCTTEKINTDNNANGLHNRARYDALAVIARAHLLANFNIDSIIQWRHDVSTGISINTVPVISQNGTRDRDKYIFNLRSNGIKYHLTLKKINPNIVFVTEMSRQRDGIGMGYLLTGDNYVYPEPKYTSDVTIGAPAPAPAHPGVPAPVVGYENIIHDNSNRYIRIDINISDTGVSEVIPGSAPAAYRFGTVEIKNAKPLVMGVINRLDTFTPVVLQSYNVDRRNQTFYYLLDTTDINQLQIVTNIKTIDNRIGIQYSTKTQIINVQQIPIEPVLNANTFSDATVINRNNTNKRVTVTPNPAVTTTTSVLGLYYDNVLQREERIMSNIPHIIDIDPSKRVELRLYSNITNKRSQKFVSRVYNFGSIVSALITRVEGTNPTYTNTGIPLVLTCGDNVTIRVESITPDNSWLCIFKGYVDDSNSRDYTDFGIIAPPGPEVQVYNTTVLEPRVARKFVKFLVCLKTNNQENMSGIDFDDIITYKEITFPLLCANVTAEEINGKCRISVDMLNATQVELKKNSNRVEARGRIPVDTRLHQFTVDRFLGDAANAYSVVVTSNKTKIEHGTTQTVTREKILTVNCPALAPAVENIPAAVVNQNEVAVDEVAVDEVAVVVNAPATANATADEKVCGLPKNNKIFEPTNIKKLKTKFKKESYEFKDLVDDSIKNISSSKLNIAELQKMFSKLDVKYIDGQEMLIDRRLLLNFLQCVAKAFF